MKIKRYVAKNMREAIRMVLSEVRSHEQHDTALRRAFAVLDNLGEGVAVADANGAIVAVNPAFSAICGHNEAQAISSKLNPFDPTLRYPASALRAAQKGD